MALHAPIGGGTSDLLGSIQSVSYACMAMAANRKVFCLGFDSPRRGLIFQAGLDAFGCRSLRGLTRPKRRRQKRVKAVVVVVVVAFAKGVLAICSWVHGLMET